MARANLTGSVVVGGSKPPRGRRQQRRGRRRSGWCSAVLLELGSLALLLAIVQPPLWDAWLNGTIAERVSDRAANPPMAEPEPGSVEFPVEVERQQFAAVEPVRNEPPATPPRSAQGIVRPVMVPISRSRGYGASWSDVSAAGGGHTQPFSSGEPGLLRIRALPAPISGLSGY